MEGWGEERGDGGRGEEKNRNGEVKMGRDK